MPMSPDTKGGLIGAGISALGQGISAWSQGSMNRKTREWNEKMYGLQRANALADWEMQNAYNSPASQMQRYREAGLNPNLIYGQTNTAQPVRSTDTKQWSPQAPQVNPAPILSSYFDVATRSAQIDNLKAANTVQQMDALLKMAQIDSLNAGTENKLYDLGFKQTIKDLSIDVMKAGLNKTLASTQFTIDENERQQAMQAPNLQMAAINILKGKAEAARTKADEARIYAQIDNLRKSGKILDWEIQLSKDGMTKGDPLWMRALQDLINGNDAGSLGKYVPNAWKKGQNEQGNKMAQDYLNWKKANGLK